jgi:transmembrane sensor
MDEKATYHLLFAKKLAGEITNEEQGLLTAWLNESPQHKQEMAQWERAWHQVGGADTFTPDVDTAWSKVKHRIGQGQTLRVEKKEAKVIGLFSSSLLRIAASIVLVSGLSYLGFRYLNPAHTEVLLSTIDEKTLFTLPDSSQVWLKPQSQLSYTEGFEGDVREVKLNGEAFFEVKRNEEKPFVVLGQKTRVQVLGTSFVVHAKQGDQREFVVVNTGKVQFSEIAQANNQVVLTKGDEAVFLPQQKMEVKAKSSANAATWKTNKLVFDNTSLQQVLRDLELYLGVPVKVANKGLLQCRFTGTFDTPSAESVLIVLSLSTHSTYRKTGNGYVLEGEGCGSVNN